MHARQASLAAAISRTNNVSPLSLTRDARLSCSKLIGSSSTSALR
jgi:hypothetical protein